MEYIRGEIIYFLQKIESKNSKYPLVELGAMDLSFKQMQNLRDNEFEYNGAYWITKTNEIPISPKKQMYLKPQIVKDVYNGEPFFGDV